MYTVVLFTLSFQGGVITSLLCLAVHCKRCWSIRGGPGVSDHNDLTPPSLCLLAPGSRGWPFDGHLQGPHSNNSWMTQTQWLCQSRSSLGHKRYSDWLSYYSLRHGWIRTPICGPSCTRKGRTGWHEMMRILLQWQKKGRRRQEGQEGSSSRWNLCVKMPCLSPAHLIQ